MRIQSTYNGAHAEVSDEQAERLIAAGGWRLPRKPRAPKHSKPAPVEEPKTEE
ncbi:hypothetical protein SEA_GAUGELDP_19 [Mycobacterium phage GaugeLDP]|nr:hypothetical protein SEA_GAUGELDP_19 [Mycobacterium phage GaugeLDP]